MAKSNIDALRSTIITDQFGGYYHFYKTFDHEIIDHRSSYARGVVHTNNIESFWAILKRGIYRQYHSVTKRHINRYIGEFCYRHNNRINPAIFEQTIQRGLGVTQ